MVLLVELWRSYLSSSCKIFALLKYPKSKGVELMAEIGNREMKGVIPPMITSFKKNGDLDKRAIKEVVSFLKTRVHGLFVNGTYGCGLMMNVNERKEVLETVMEEAGDSIQVCVHIGATTNRDAIDLGKHAAEIGVVGVASVPPYYYPHKEADIESYFENLINEIEAPVYFYNNPVTTSFAADAGILSRLAEKGLKGVKDSSFDILTFYSFIRSVKKEGFHFIMGSEALILPAVIMGGRASVAGMANCLPEEVVALWQASENGDIEKASKLQKKILNLRDVFKSGSTIPLVHQTLRERGVNAGYPRAPFREQPVEVWKEVRSKLENLGIEF